MKRFLAPIALALFLSACGMTVASYAVDIRTEDAEQRSELAGAIQRVVERKLASMGESSDGVDLSADGKTALLKVDVEDKRVHEALNGVLTDPFKLRIMAEAPEDQADIVVEGHGGFAESGLTEEHLQWLTATEEDGQRGRIIIDFTSEGRDLMKEIFETNKGKFIGIFVKDQLVSKLLVDTDVLLDQIIITEIPSLELAEVFADDVNVGLYVTFTPTE